MANSRGVKNSRKGPPVLADWEGTTSFGRVLWTLRKVFTVPTFVTFCALATGMVCQVGQRTVTGMLLASGMSRVWHHSVAHSFFSRTCWSLDALGLAVLDLALARLVEVGAPVRLAIDDTLFLRSGRRVAHAFWQYNGSAAGPRKLGYGNNFVVVGVLVNLPMMSRTVCLPVLFRLRRRGEDAPKAPQLARELIELVCAHLPGREVRVAADGAYANKSLKGLPKRVSVVTRLRKDAALYRQAPPRPAKPGRGRPPLQGGKLPSLTDIAGDQRRRWHEMTVTRYGQTRTVRVLTLVALWYEVFHTQPVRIVLIEDPRGCEPFEIALVCTDPSVTAEQIVNRYADRWSIEVAFQDAKNITGVGQARNRTPRAVQRTVPFGLIIQSLTVIWYAEHGDPAADVARRRELAHWYDTKTEPSTADMQTALRRQILTDQFQARTGRTVDPRKITDPAQLLELMAA